jgi:hypothetical protein
MRNDDLPINQGRIDLMISEDGVVDGSISWNLSEDLPQVCVDAMVESLHGLLCMMVNDPQKVMDTGSAYLLGATADHQGEREPQEEDLQLEFDFELDDNVVPLTPSNRKH